MLRQKCSSGLGDIENVRKRSNVNCSTRPDSFSQLKICVSQKGIRVLPRDKHEKFQSVHSLVSYQNGRAIPVEKNIARQGLYVQNRPEGCIFFSLTKAKVSNICKFQVQKSIMSVSLPVLWFGISPKDFHKVHTNFHFSLEKTICTTGHVFGRYTTYGLLKRGTGACKGYPDIIYSSEPKVFDKCKEISFSAMLDSAIFGHGNQLSRHNLYHFKRKEA